MLERLLLTERSVTVVNGKASVQGLLSGGLVLRNANLTWVVGLSQEQIELATGDHTTQLPGYLQRPEPWSKNIENDQTESSGNTTA